MASRTPPPTEDIYVSREAILAFFAPPPGRSTFFDWVNEGRVVRGPVKGYYKLNESLRRLRLPLVDIHAYRAAQQELTETQQARHRHFLALSLAVPEALHVFASEKIPETLTAAEVTQVQKLVKGYERDLTEYALADSATRLAFVGSALKALSYL